jgi:hypothetical protein
VGSVLSLRVLPGLLELSFFSGFAAFLADGAILLQLVGDPF